MAIEGPSGAEVRAAKRNAVGGGRKRCRKGKNCSAACIQAGMACLVEMPEPASVATSKVVGMLQERQGKVAPPVKKEPPAPPIKKEPVAAPIKKEPPAPPIKKAPAEAPATPELSGVEKIQKFADDRKLKDLEAQAEEYKKRWGDTIGKGDLEASNKAKAVWDYTKKQYEEFKKEYDDKYNRPVAKTPTELMAQEANRVKERLNKRVEEGIDWWAPEKKAPIIAQREDAIKDFRKLSNDQLAALGLYGENQSKYYMDVNKFLRTGSMDGIPAERQQTVQNIVTNLKGALDKLPASPDTKFERAVSGAGASGLRNLKVGDIIQDKGFGSFTVAGNPVTLDQFFRQGEDNALMRVTSRNARRVAPVMEFERENEHIMRPGTKYRVTEVIEDGHRSRKVGSMPTYIFEEVEE